MKISLLLLPGILALGSFLCWADNDGPKPNNIVPAQPQDKDRAFETTPDWSDEFDYSGLPDPAKWGYDIGGSGWGNNELEYYSNDFKNAGVANGLLTISAIKEEINGMHYSSARLVTKNKFDFLYGRIEVKAKVPAGKGTWPAIWMLPTVRKYGLWPKSGEIDIMEHVGYDPDVIHISTHCEAYYWRLNNQKTAVKKIENAITAFHLYRIDWTPNTIRGYIDDNLVFTNVNEGTGYQVWPFDQQFHLLLNVAVGGDWGGIQGIDEAAFPASMQVDYVRYYKMIDK